MLNRDYKGITTDNAYTLMDYKQIYLHKGSECPWAYDKEEEIKVLYKKLSETLKKLQQIKYVLMKMNIPILFLQSVFRIIKLFYDTTV